MLIAYPFRWPSIARALPLLLLAGLFAGACSEADRTENDAGRTDGSGLLAFYPLNGNALDVSGREAHATYYLEGYGEDRFEEPGRAATMFGRFEDVTVGLVEARAYPLIHGPSPALEGNFTMTGWFKHYNARAEPGRIFGEGNGFAVYMDNFGRPEDGGFISFGRLDERAPIEPTVSDPSICCGADWIFVAGVVSTDGASSLLRLYVDGEQVAETAVQGEVFDEINDCRFYIGPGLAFVREDPMTWNGEALVPFNAGSECAIDFSLASFPGEVDDVRVYSRALGASEVRELFEEGS